MAVKVSAEVTVTDVTDAKDIVTWYQLSSSATKPNKPTTTDSTVTPSGWVKTEPSFNPSQGTRYLYTCQQLVWGDNTCSWGDVQRSSSYEQAKAAWNAANAAQETADSIEIGGRNLASSAYDIYNQTAYLVYKIPVSESLAEIGEGSVLTLQLWGIELDSGSSGICVYWGGGNISVFPYMLPDDNGYACKTITVNNGQATNAHAVNKFITIYNFISGHSGASLKIDHWKLEKGNKPTDWTPAPEDQTAYVDSTADSIQVGGRNLFVNSLASNGYPTDKAVGTQYAITGMSSNHEAYQLVPVEEGASYIFQYWVDNSEYPGWACIQLLDENGLVVSKPARVFPQANYWTKAFTVPSGVTTALISGRHLAVGFSYAKLKFEKGTKATDWTPAPEDTDTFIAAVQTNLDNLKIGGRNLVYNSGDYAGWLKLTGVTVNGDELDINASGLSSNKFYGAKQWLTRTSSDLNGSSLVVSFEVYSDAWESVTSDRNAGFESATMQILSVTNPYGSSASGSTGLYRYMSLAAQTAHWAKKPEQENGKWLRFESLPIDIPAGLINTDSGTDFNPYLIVYPNLRRNGHVKFRHIKVEVGTKATDWTPAPEDTDASIAAVQDNLDNLEIGGRNLLLWSAPSAENHTKIANPSSTNGFTTEDGYACYKITGGATNGTQYASNGKRIVLLEADTQYTYSAWVKLTTTDSATNVPFNFTSLGHFAIINDASTASDKTHEDIPAKRVYSPATISVNVWTKIQLTFTTNSLNGSAFGLYPKYNLANAYTLFIRDQKLEKGTKATDWTPAPDDVDADISTKLDASYNRIWYAECSTPAATTAKVAIITPTTTSFTLVKGQTVNVLFTATNTGAVGSLTLNVNNTGAKSIKYLSNGALANLPAANYLRTNQIVTFTYDGTYWVTDFSYNSDTYNRTRWQNAVKILEQPTGTWRILCGTSSGYKQVATGISFDLSYPLLAFSNQPAANATADTGYLSVNSLTYSNTAAIQSGAANKTIYLKGTVNGNTFTIDGTNVFTTVIPTSEDGRCYIPLGIMTSATAGYFKSSKDLYAYVDGAFGPVSIREASAAAKTATNYISADSNGIKIANANPATATTYQHLTATSTEFVVEGDSMLELDGTNGARVGKEDGINTCVGSGGFYIRNSNDVRAGFEYEAASGSTPGNTTIESSDGLKLYGNVSSIDGTETGKTYVLLSGIRYNRDSEKASVAIVANSDPDNSSGDGNGSHIASIHLDGGNTSGDSIPSGEPSVSIHVGGESFDIGKPTSVYDTGSVSVANQSWVSVANLTIPSTGTWIVVVTGDFAANATGRRVVGCTRNAAPSSTPAYDSQNSLIMAPANGAPTKFNSSAIIDFDKNDVYYAGVWQNSGRALQTRIMIKAVRLI